MHGCRSEEHTSELQSHLNLVCRLLLEKKIQGPPRGAGALPIRSPPKKPDTCAPTLSLSSEKSRQTRARPTCWLLFLYLFLKFSAPPLIYPFSPRCPFHA